MAKSGAYPVNLTVDYPEELNRLTTAFRLILVIPVLIVSALLSNSVGILFLPPLLLIVFRQKYPRWWFDWNLMILRFLTRIEVYAFLLRDEYPSTDEDQAVHLDIGYPNAKRDLNRWLPWWSGSWRSRTSSCWCSSTSRCWWSRSSPGSPSCSPAATRADCSTSWWVCTAGPCA
jgi:hypothetical protein